MAARRERGRGPREAGHEARRALDLERGVFMISVAAELAGMHPQTLRMYEARGLIRPKRSPKNTRLYSQVDVERLQRIHELTAEMGMNLAGVERIFELEGRLREMSGELERLARAAEEMERRMNAALELAHRPVRFEVVPYEGPGEVVRAADAGPPQGMRIPIRKRKSD